MSKIDISVFFFCTQQDERREVDPSTNASPGPQKTRQTNHPRQKTKNNTQTDDRPRRNQPGSRSSGRCPPTQLEQVGIRPEEFLQIGQLPCLRERFNLHPMHGELAREFTEFIRMPLVGGMMWHVSR